MLLRQCTLRLPRSREGDRACCHEALEVLRAPSCDAVDIEMLAEDLAGAVLQGAERTGGRDVGEAGSGANAGELECTARNGIGEPGFLLGLQPGEGGEFRALHPAASSCEHRAHYGCEAQGEADEGDQQTEPAEDVADEPEWRSAKFHGRSFS